MWIGLVEQHARPLPGALLVAPVGVFGRNARVDVGAGLRVPQQPDRACDGREQVLEAARGRSHRRGCRRGLTTPMMHRRLTARAGARPRRRAARRPRARPAHGGCRSRHGARPRPGPLRRGDLTSSGEARQGPAAAPSSSPARSPTVSAETSSGSRSPVGSKRRDDGEVQRRPGGVRARAPCSRQTVDDDSHRSRRTIPTTAYCRPKALAGRTGRRSGFALPPSLSSLGRARPRRRSARGDQVPTSSGTDGPLRGRRAGPAPGGGGKTLAGEPRPSRPQAGGRTTFQASRTEASAGRRRVDAEPRRARRRLRAPGTPARAEARSSVAHLAGELDGVDRERD